jgi:cytochrome c oxidase subunit 1
LTIPHTLQAPRTARTITITTDPQAGAAGCYATNHKDIGTLYLLFSFTMLMVGGVLALLIRAELFQPGLQLVNPELFNQLTTMHGLIMVFGAIMPAFVGFANWMIPLQIGASDMAFARMNNFSFWLMIPAALHAGGLVLHARRRARRRLDAVCAADAADGPLMDAGIFAMHILGARPSWARSTSSSPS